MQVVVEGVAMPKWGFLRGICCNRDAARIQSRARFLLASKPSPMAAEVPGWLESYPTRVVGSRV
jgi:hypothetical protein